MASSSTDDTSVLPCDDGAVHVGRDRERKVLEEALTDAVSGRGRLVLLTGEPGMGKTRLCEETERDALEREFAVLWGRAWDGGGAPPYWPWTQALRSFLRGSRGRALLESIADIAEDLRPLVPDLGGRRGPAPPPSMQDPAARFRLSDAVVTFLRAATLEQPLLVILDDLHAADPPTLKLLQFVAAESRDLRLLLLATYRDAEVRLSSELSRTLAEIGRLGTVLALPRLESAEIGELMSEASDRRIPQSLARVLHARTAGNPLYALELARYLSQNEASAARAELTVPHTVADTIVGRLDLLSPAARELLLAGSVGGNELDVTVLARLAGLSGNACLSLVDEGVRAGLIAALPNQRFAFSHSLFRDAIYRSLSISRRATLHHAFAEAAEESYAAGLEPRYADLAHHYRAGQSAGGRDKLLRYERLAGQRAAAQLAFEEAASHFTRALEAAGPAGDARERCDLLIELGDVRLAAGDAHASAETFARAAELARALAEPRLLGRIALCLGRKSPTQARSNQTLIELSTEALAALGDAEPALRARLAARLAAELVGSSPAEREKLARGAIALARQVGDPETLALVLLGAYHSLWTVDNLDERLALASEIERIAETLDRPHLVLRGRHTRLLALLEVDDIAGAERDLAACSRLAVELRDPHYQWLAQLHGAMLALLRGRLAEAEELADEAYRLGERSGSAREPRSNHLLFLWRLRKEQGRLGELAPRIEAIVAEAPEHLGWRTMLAQVRLANGQTEAAREIFGAIAAQGWEGVPRDILWLGHMVSLAEVALELREDGTLQRLHDALLPFETRNVIQGRGTVSFGPVALTLGKIAAARGQRPAARAFFERALKSAEQSDSVLFVAHAAQALGQLGDGEQAGRAREAFARAGLSASQPVAAVEPQPAAPAAPSGELRFVLEGDLWHIHGPQGERLLLRDSKGMRYLAELVSRPGREIHVAQLASLYAGDELPPESDAGEMLDVRARTQYRSRIEDLDETITDAERRGDVARLRAARHEREYLAAELARAVGLGGRERRAGAQAERLRQSVTKRIRGAIKKIVDESPAVGKTLDQAVRTGVFCVYEPPVAPDA